MRIDFNPGTGKFIVWHSADQWTDLDNCKAIPNKRYDKTDRCWIAAPTTMNVKYLSRWWEAMTPRAQEAAKRIEAGPVVSKGSLPVTFEFKTTPRPHQLEALLRMVIRPEYALAMDPGTGKSKIIIDGAACDIRTNKGNAQLVVCPNSIKGNWRDEVFLHGFGQHVVHVYEADEKAKANKFINEPPPSGAVKWLIMGVESFSQGDAKKIAEKFLLCHKVTLTIDESHKIKNHDKTRTKELIKLSKMAHQRRIATGTMISKGIHQAWSQYEFLNPNILDMSFFGFRARFCVMGGYKQKQIVGNMNEAEFIELIAPYTFRASKAEVLKDLPPKVYQVREVRPTEEQQRLYQELRKEGIAFLANNPDEMVVFTNTLVRDLRLQQISGGFVALADKPDEEGYDFSKPEDVERYIQQKSKARVVPIGGPNPKLKECLEICEDVPGKIIFWCRFKDEIQALVEALRKEYGDRAVVEFHGDISNRDRDEARHRFQKDPECLYFVGQESTGGVGITLTAAETMVYYSNTWPLEDRIQSEDRFHRIGQTGTSVLIIDIIMNDGKKPWVDHRVLEALRAGKSYTEAVMERIRLATTEV